VKSAWAVLAAACTGCFGSPTPLVPGLEGSVGVPHHGVLTVATELPVAGAGFVRYRKLGPNHWGNPRLVRALEQAALTVEERMPGGAPLIVGDLSAQTGGKIPRHASHRTGRDVDLPWFVTTPEGVPVQNPGFIPVGADGLAPIEGTDAFLRIDLPREWQLVKALITSPDIDVQWMFCSKEVEALLIDYARARGEAPTLVFRAETVLMEPSDSLPHDDHIHLRIACTPEEAILGCEGGGPRWEWMAPLPESPMTVESLYDVVLDDPLRVPAESGIDTTPG
jgi:penicillin-insensitive murein endopeptidase